jgi:hypothetical protein
MCIYYQIIQILAFIIVRSYQISHVACE